MVLVDTGSSDSTADIAQRTGVKVVNVAKTDEPNNAAADAKTANALTFILGVS